LKPSFVHRTAALCSVEPLTPEATLKACTINPIHPPGYSLTNANPSAQKFWTLWNVATPALDCTLAAPAQLSAGFYQIMTAEAHLWRTFRIPSSLCPQVDPAAIEADRQNLKDSVFRIKHGAEWLYDAAFLQSVGRLAPPSDNGPHASVLAAYQRFLSEVRGLAPTTIAQHLPEVSALLRHALPEGEALDFSVRSTSSLTVRE
jgi:hypothetical protein